MNMEETEKVEASRRIFVTRLAHYTNKKDLMKIFKPEGVESVVIRRQGFSNTAFFTLSSSKEAAQLLEKAKVHNFVVHKRNLRLFLADPWHNRDAKHPKLIDQLNEEEVDTDDEESSKSEEIILPQNCIAKIASYLTFYDRAKLEQVSKLWRKGTCASYASISSLSTTSWLWKKTGKNSVITASQFYWAMRRCNMMLRSIILEENTQFLTPQLLSLIGKHCHYLQQISVTGMVIRPNGLRAIAENMKELRLLHIGATVGPVERELENIFNKNPNLSDVKFVNSNISGRSLSQLNNNVENLTIYNCNRLHNEFLVDCIEEQTQLRKLHLTWSKKLECHEIAIAIARNPNMKTLESLKIGQLGCSEIKEENMDHKWDIEFEHFYELEELVANNLPQTSHNLQSLELVCCPWVINSFVDKIGRNLHDLSSLDISGCLNIRGNKALQPFRNLSNLKTLKMNTLHSSVTACFLSKLRNLQSLECRDCCGFDAEEICDLLYASKDLSYLDLEGCVNIGTEVVDCANYLFRSNYKTSKLTLLLGGTRAEFFCNEKNSELLDVHYVRRSKVYDSNIQFKECEASNDSQFC